MAPTTREGSSDSQVPVGGRPPSCFPDFLCMPSAIRDRSLMHTRRVPPPNCKKIAWSWPWGEQEPGSCPSCPRSTLLPDLSVPHLLVFPWSMPRSLPPRSLSPSTEHSMSDTNSQPYCWSPKRKRSSSRCWRRKKITGKDCDWPGWVTCPSGLSAEAAVGGAGCVRDGPSHFLREEDEGLSLK